MNQQPAALNATRSLPRKPAGGAGGLGRVLRWPAAALLLGGLWLVTWQGYYTPGSDVGYNLGLIGGLMMLALLLYPLRKRVRFMRVLGAARYWFRLHMLFGIAGPVLILFHSTFSLGSLNATIAFVSMLVVAGSGVVGRFIYTKIHHGLYGRRATLQDLQVQMGICEGDVRSRFHFAPAVEERLKRFESASLAPRRTLVHGAWRFFTIALRAWLVHFLAYRELRHTMAAAATQRGWERSKLQRRLRSGSELIWSYLHAVQKEAQFSTYERLFALWHVLHIPFVYMLALSAIVHVLAVHMY